MGAGATEVEKRKGRVENSGSEGVEVAIKEAK